MTRLFRVVILTAAVAVVACGCGGHLKQVRTAFYEQRAGDALALLEEPAADSRRDRLLYLMAEGTIYNHLGRYQESTKAFLAAADLIDQQDVIRVTQQAASLATNEWVTQYKGEYAERLWVHTYLMMNFLLMDRPESAQVEARRALKVYDAYEEVLSGDLFSRALIALSFDLLGEDNDAYIEYKRVAEGLGTPAPVARELTRLAMLLWEPTEADRYREEIPESVAQWSPDRSGAELILFVSWGQGPEKIPRNFVVPPGIRFSFPAYRGAPPPGGSVEVIVDDDSVPSTEISLDVGRVANASLAARRAQVLTKEAARVAAKEALVRRLENDKDAATALAGALLRATFVAIEEADTRSWETLPATIRMVRVPIPAQGGSVFVRVDLGGLTKEIDLGNIETQGRKHVFRSVRILE